MKKIVAGLVLGLAASAHAGQISQLLDINRSVALPQNAVPPVQLGSKWLLGFCAPSSYSCQPWVTDGTADGTVQLATVGSGYYAPPTFVVSGAYAYFVGFDGSGYSRLWRTDGTKGGTGMVSNTVTDFGSLTAAGSYLYYTTGSTYSASAPAVWRTDGTPDGTLKLAELFQPGSLTAVGSSIFFVASGGTWGRELWKSDGTFAGTAVVRDIIPGTDGSSPVKLAAVGGRLFFWARKNILSAATLWVSDGTDAGTVEAAPISPADVGDIVDFGGKAHFLAYGSNGTMSLLQSDGTPAGTVTLHTWTGGSIQKMVVVGPYLYVVAPNGSSSALWRSDGTPAGTVPSTDSTVTNPSSLVASGGALHFVALGPGGTQRLYRTQGSAATTSVEISSNPGVPVGDLGGQLLLNRSVAWILDNGTLRVFKTAAGEANNSSYCADGTATLDGVAYFAANDGEHGCELWRTDGTAAGTWLVSDLLPGESSGLSAAYYSATDLQFVSSNGLVYFVGTSDVNGSRTLYRTDGSASGTIALLSGASTLKLAATSFGVYAFAGSQLIRSDGSVAGTSVLYSPASSGDSPIVNSLVSLGNTALWLATTGGSYGALSMWRSDGTAAGTAAFYSWPADPYYYVYDSTLWVNNGQAFLRGYSSAAGSELWRTDGTAAGTRMVADVSAGTASGFGGFVGNAGNRVLFSGPGGLWSSDGTTAGTGFLTASYPYYYTPAPRTNGPYFYFLSYSYPYALIRTDGTFGGTTTLAQSIDSAYNLTTVGTAAYFLGNSYPTGRELWLATGAGASPIEDYVPGSGSLTTSSSNASRMMVLPSALVFFAGAPASSVEPMVLAFDTTPDAMTFSPIAPVSPGALVTSGPAQVGGMSAPAAAVATNGQLCVSSTNGCTCNLSAFASSATVEPGNFVCLRQTASTAASTATTTILSIGGMSASFTSTTGANQLLTVAIVGTGQGTVSSSAPGIDCGTDCTESVGYGNTVSLAARRQIGSIFTGWSGACAGTGPCVVSMTGARSVTASFAAGPRKGLAPDLDNDGIADIIWKGPSGETGAWLMNGTSYRATGMVPPPAAGATVVFTGDFNGDGRTDLLWKTPGNAYYMTLQDGVTTTSTLLVSGPGAGWIAVAKGDFDGDGKTDLIWRNAIGAHELSLMDGAIAKQSNSLGSSLPGAAITLVADFNGDGKSDIVWSGSDGSAEMYLMAGTAVIGSKSLIGAGTGWSAIAYGDLNGDGYADLLWRHTDGRVGMWFMNGTTAWSYGSLLGPGTGWTVKLVRDFDGDGKSDLVWSNTDGSQALWLMNGGTPVSYIGLVGAGTGWNVVASEDYDGDGKDDLLWRGPNGEYALWLMDGIHVHAYRTLLGAGTGWEAVP